MGRKIPGKKHRGIKDPDKQRAERWAELKTKINDAPRETDEQAIPKSLARVMKLKEAVKSGKFIAKKKKKKRKTEANLIKLGPQNLPTHPKAKPEKSVPIFDQNPGESNSDFLNRVNRETHLFVNETIFEKKYNVEIKRNPETGEVEGIANAPKDEIDELVRLKMKHKNIGKKKKKKTSSSENEPKLTKEQKRRQKLKLKREKKLQAKTDDSMGIRDKVAFGDIVHAPPNLNLKPIKHKGTVPGRRDLLLNALLSTKVSSEESKAKKVVVNMSGKRKDLPSAERRLLEKQQSDVINAYRLMKARNSSSTN